MGRHRFWPPGDTACGSGGDTAIKEILLAVEESKIALTPDGIQLQVGESTVIRLSKDGITIVGGSVFIN
ncbi:TPA: type VI secretion protein [Escherichia coli]|nr:type VI secretion protein [Escherichia coli]AHM35535.1 type VI secretion protein [Escherichia coli]AHM40132.1 type VI secretion protein [Escherichia coli]EIU6251334.1 type VI secretion protein [Escherichia coli]EKQ3326290.1 type VI secretion protein [Escherichia coli]